jgi:hypothetical protein
MSIWASLMLIAGGLFAGGAATFAWSRVPIWRRMPVQGFIGDFEETLRRTDKVQPALLVAAIVSAAGFALTADGSARVLASVGAAGFVVTLAASLAFLVPLQRRLVRAPEVGQAAEQRLQRDLRFQACEWRAQAEVDALPERKMAVGVSGHVKLVRV